MNLTKKVGLDDVLGQMKGKRVIMRVDFNCPVKEGVVKDNTRIRATLPSIKAILKAEPKCLILMSHLGRPDGKRTEKDTLKSVSVALEELLGNKVNFLGDCVGGEVEKACLTADKSEVILLENLRFHPEEEGSSVGEDGKKVKCSKEDVEKFRD